MKILRIGNGINIIVIIGHVQPVLGLHHVAAGGDPHSGALGHKVPLVLISVLGLDTIVTVSFYPPFSGSDTIDHHPHTQT